MKYSFLNIHDAVTMITVVEILFLCLALKFLLNKREQPYQLLIVFFLFVAGTLSTTLIVWNGYLETQAIARSSLIIALMVFCFLMEGPMLYAYLRSLPGNVKIWRWPNLLHILPPAVVAIAVVVIDIRIVDWLPSHWDQLPPVKDNAIRFIWGMQKSWPLIYVIACVYEEYKLRRRMSDMYSNISPRELLAADIILAGFFIHWCWAFVAYILSDYISAGVHDLLGIISTYFTVVLVNALFVYALINGRRMLALPEVLSEPVDSKTPVKNMEEKVRLVEQVVRDKQIYLNSQINLERFAEYCGLKPREISIVLNRRYGRNFFEFINELRVNEVKDQLLKYPEKTILDIAIEAGFNSQSAFQRFFKRLEGVTPSEYRRRANATQKI